MTVAALPRLLISFSTSAGVRYSRGRATVNRLEVGQAGATLALADAYVIETIATAD